MNYAAWLWFTLTAKWCLTSERFHMKGIFFFTQSFSLLWFNKDIQSCVSAWLKFQCYLQSCPQFQLKSGNYCNHSFKSSGAVKIRIQDNSYTYWLEMSFAEGCTNVSEMSQVEQNAIVGLWHPWLPFDRQILINQAKIDVDRKYLGLSICFGFSYNLLRLIFYHYCCHWGCCVCIACLMPINGLLSVLEHFK